MKTNNDRFEDILNSFVIEVEESFRREEPLKSIDAIEHTAEILLGFDTTIEQAKIENQASIQENKKKNHTSEKKPTSKVLLWCFFLIRYVTTSSLIFIVLLVTSNYSAYFSLIKSYVFSDSLERSKESLISSVEAGSLSLSDGEYRKKAQELETKSGNQHSINQLLAKSNEEDVSLNIDITPYENRIIIPKIWKNIPLLDIKQQVVSGHSELEDIFMKDLEKWVIRYPGSAKPWDIGNAFIFGHSSNFPWVPWEYNDVFALLDHLENGDQIIVYYKQKKFVYEVQWKTTITPGDVTVLKKESKDAELSVMTCWPVGTTLKRLVVNAKLIPQK
jgi:LPXTG-site transpeptidase (sortase) family protein